MSKKRLGYKWSGFWMGSKFRKPNHLKFGQMVTILSKIILIWAKMSGFQMVQFSNGWDYSYNPTILKPEHLKSDLQKVRIPIFWISDPQWTLQPLKSLKTFFLDEAGQEIPDKMNPVTGCAPVPEPQSLIWKLTSALTWLPAHSSRLSATSWSRDLEELNLKKIEKVNTPT